MTKVNPYLFFCFVQFVGSSNVAEATLSSFLSLGWHFGQLWVKIEVVWYITSQELISEAAGISWLLFGGMTSIAKTQYPQKI